MTGPEMTREEASKNLEALCEEEELITAILQKNGRHWVKESDTERWQKRTVALRMAIAALRRENAQKELLAKAERVCNLIEIPHLWAGVKDHDEPGRELRAAINNAKADQQPGA